MRDSCRKNSAKQVLHGTSLLCIFVFSLSYLVRHCMFGTLLCVARHVHLMLHRPYNVLSTSRFYRKLARRQQQILFGRVDASTTPELARKLGLTAVPAFVTFREGEVVTSTATSNKKKIEKLVEELLYE